MKKFPRILLLMTIDSIFISIAVIGAYLLRFNFLIPKGQSVSIPYVIAFQIVGTLTCFYIFKVYRRIWQYASIGDLLSIIKGSIFSSGIFFVIHYFGVHAYFQFLMVPRSIYPLTTMLIILTVGGSRATWRILRDNYMSIQPHHTKALIIGAGSAGAMVIKELKHTISNFYPWVFIDDDPKKLNLEIMGVPVVGNRNDIISVVHKENIKYIILAIPSASKAEIASILEICKKTECKIKIIPLMNDLIHGKISINMIRDVSVEDLLGREPVQINLAEIAGYIKEQTILVTGAGGSIGSELCRQISNHSPKKLLLLGHGENSIYDIERELRKKYTDIPMEPIIADVQDRERIKQVMRTYSPDVVFHAAAHKHVPLMEKNPLEAIKNNVFGTKNVAELSHEYGVKRFVMISTDKVVNPTSVMGATKRIAEMIVQSLNEVSDTIFASVRFGNVLGSRGSVVPLFKAQINEGGPVTVTHPEMVRYFMTIPEAVQLVIQAGSYASEGEVFVLDMGQPVKISDLAHDLIRLSGLEPGKDIEIQYTGIRPGEKLYEEILTYEEGTSATTHHRIYVGKPAYQTYSKLVNVLEEYAHVISMNEQVEVDEVKRMIKKIVPTYQIKEQVQDQTTMQQVKSFQASFVLQESGGA